MLKLLMSAFRRIVTAVTNPFRMLLVRVQRMFNINVITAKLVRPLTKKVKELITLRPQSREDYYVIGKWWVYKKVFLTLLLAACAGVFIYFSMFAPKLPAAATAASVETTVYYDYSDMDLRDFTGVANIRAGDGQVVYTGVIDKGACTGTGTLWDRKGRLEYRGGFEQNQFAGRGTYYYPDGKKKYEGEWAQNLYQGAGILYAEDGETPIYSGSFANGLYEGQGTAWTPSGVLLYEGNFSAGKYHGQGVSYYPDGTVRYKGEFLAGFPQGKGELYSETGKLLYTGDVYAGQINYRALVNYSFAEVKEAFTEAPRVFYSDTDSAFLFEQAGVVVTVDCRVKLDVWERPAEDRDYGAYYYMPDQSGQGSGEAGSIPASPPSSSAPSSGGTPPSGSLPQGPYLSPESGGAQTVGTGRGSAPVRARALARTAPGRGEVPWVTPVEWYVAGTGPSGDSSSGGSQSSAGGTTQPDPAPSEPQIREDGGTTSSGSQTPQVPQASGKTYPDFVEKDQKLYFEIDAGVWQSEEELEAEKVRVKKVTVYTGELPELPAGAVEFEDNAPPGLEDCVAIDLLRQRIPTAFSQIQFEADRQNRLFVRLWNINFAGKIDQRAFLSGDLTYRLAYQNKSDQTPLYFSVER